MRVIPGQLQVRPTMVRNERQTVNNRLWKAEACALSQPLSLDVRAVIKFLCPRIADERTCGLKERDILYRRAIAQMRNSSPSSARLRLLQGLSLKPGLG